MNYIESYQETEKERDNKLLLSSHIFRLTSITSNPTKIENLIEISTTFSALFLLKVYR